ncbi:ArsR family transcriptional regulator [Lederbergia sp. NSJ-179]|uniref:ArsR/SmtB family transcription factor n=1 Tax=Lederbergia sp. NSJ-179 TaxID=2931402 RepID=UPI001FD0B4C2|nr:ArsR family transcriptional regulator [Lederbergia sp. NSJ-179]MCJ7842882.1 ArsR family transcriptional regulator [Lederbergia sp. NSJ-179]
MLELSIEDPKSLKKIAHALSSEVRLQIINLLNKGNMNVNQLAESLDIPVSTTASHIKILEKSDLINTELRPASRGAMKVCKRNFDDIHIQLNSKENFKRNTQKIYEMEMPIGQYIDFDVAPTCGMANHEGMIIPEDEPVHFYSPDRSKAQIMWTRKGYFEYKFPLVIPVGAAIETVQLSLELCSEAPNHDHNWPSDITVWINEVEIGTWTSPGDFGDRPGKMNPKYWSETTSTQYGSLKTWKVTKKNTTIDEFHLSNVTIDDIGILERRFMSFKIGIKDDAIHKGGMNLFGREFGDHPQDIKLLIEYS